MQSVAPSLSKKDLAGTSSISASEACKVANPESSKEGFTQTLNFKPTKQLKSQSALMQGENCRMRHTGWTWNEFNDKLAITWGGRRLLYWVMPFPWYKVYYKEIAYSNSEGPPSPLAITSRCQAWLSAPTSRTPRWTACHRLNVAALALGQAAKCRTK